MSDVLTLEHVHKCFGARVVVNDLSLSVPEGKVFGFLGPNGAGKTTTIKMILGLLSMDGGKITIDGHDVVTDFENAMRYIGGIVENPDMYDYMSGYDNLLLHACAYGRDRAAVDEVVAQMGMQMRIKDKFKMYSLGMKQRLGVAQALLRKPKIMILDEPTNGLDPVGIKEFRDLVRHLASTGMSVLVSSHILQEMEQMCDVVGIIHAGNLVRVADVQELLHERGDIRRYTVTPHATAVALAQDHLADRLAGVGEGTIDLRLDEAELGEINRKFMEQGVTILGIQLLASSLEEQYLNITGGGNIIG